MKTNTIDKSESCALENKKMQIDSNDTLYKEVKLTNSPQIKPLAVALSVVLSGFPFSSQVDAQGFTSPWIVGPTETIYLYGDNQINVSNFYEGATAIIYGTLDYTKGTGTETNIYANIKLGMPYNDFNSITVYGNLIGNNNKISALYGGYGNSKIVQANNNTLFFKAGSTVKNVYVYGAKIDNNNYGTPYSATTNYNTVIIEKGSNFTGNKDLVGGYAISINNSSSSNNKIIIGSGVFTAWIRAGWTTTVSGTSSASMSNNEVYLYGDADVSSENAKIYGGIDTSYVDPDTHVKDKPGSVIAGNTLIFGYNNMPWEPSNYTVGSVNNFSTIRLDTVTWGKTIIINSLSNFSTDSRETKVDVSNVSFSGVQMLSPGDSYDMLTVSNKDPEASLGLTTGESSFTFGTALEGSGTAKLSGNTVTYTVNSIEAQPQTHTAAMAMSAAAVALNQGADTSSAASFNLANSGLTGVQAFSSVGGGMARVNTGSHVNVNTLNFSVGVGNNIQNDFGLLSVGAAFEAGFGKFKNHFNAGKADPYIKKNGDIKYYGIAVLSNMAFENLWHVNGALRYGRIETSQNRAVYNFNTNQAYDVDLSSYYIGAELGGGKVIKLDDLNSLDLYGKYFFLHQDGNTFNAGGKYELSSVNSHRLRLAGRYSHNYTPTTALYTGLGAEYEFDGKSELKVDGFWAKPSKTDGIRGFGELGVTITPASNKGLIFDFGIKGLLGDGFRGAWANAEMKYLF